MSVPDILSEGRGCAQRRIMQRLESGFGDFRTRFSYAPAFENRTFHWEERISQKTGLCGWI